MKTTIQKITLLFFVVLPFVTHAAGEDFKSLICSLVGLVNPLIALLSGLAVLAFLWGITKYIFAAGDEGKKVDGKNTMVYGLIGLFVFFSFWGIINFVQKSFNLDITGSSVSGNVCR